MASVVTLWS